MKKLIAANWKMNKNTEESVSFIKEFKKLIENARNTEIVICAPFTALQAVSNELKGSSNTSSNISNNIRLGAQNMHFEDSGAYTGEISPLMLKEIGCEYVILGHSERRGIFGEDDFLISRKIAAALKHSLKPILCVGESLEQRDKGKTNDVIKEQIKSCLKDVKENEMPKVNIAYEPIWAISKGNPSHKSATAQDAEDAHKFIRCVLAGIFDESIASIAKSIRVIYGGSMKPENAKELLSMPNIDGGLVGNASLTAKSFAEIVKSCN